MTDLVCLCDSLDCLFALTLYIIKSLHSFISIIIMSMINFAIVELVHYLHIYALCMHTFEKLCLFIYSAFCLPGRPFCLLFSACLCAWKCVFQCNLDIFHLLLFALSNAKRMSCLVTIMNNAEREELGMHASVFTVFTEWVHGIYMLYVERYLVIRANLYLHLSLCIHILHTHTSFQVAHL